MFYHSGSEGPFPPLISSVHGALVPSRGPAPCWCSLSLPGSRGGGRSSDALFAVEEGAVPGLPHVPVPDSAGRAPGKLRHPQRPAEPEALELIASFYKWKNILLLFNFPLQTQMGRSLPGQTGSGDNKKYPSPGRLTVPALVFG